MSWPLTRVPTNDGTTVYCFNKSAARPTKHYLLHDFAEYKVYDFAIVSPYTMGVQAGPTYYGIGLRLCGTTTPLLRYALLQKA